MARPSPLLLWIRRSLLGAWLAVAYALAVLGAGLAPQQVLAHPGFDGAVLCSGLAAPATSDDLPAPSGPSHCQGCPLSPVMAAPEPLQQPEPLRVLVPMALALPAPEGVSLQSPCAPPQSRAPPVA